MADHARSKRHSSTRADTAPEARRRSLLPTAVVALVGLTAGVVTFGAAGGGSPVPTKAAAFRLVTPVLSVRRVPRVLAAEAAETALRNALATALADPTVADAAKRSCLVVRAGDRVLFDQKAEEAVMPASNMKILTAFAALDKLGPDAHLVTEARIGGGVGGIAKDGRVDGPLYLVGGGDPLLETDAYAEAQLDRTVTPPSDHRDLHTRLADLADAVAGAGVKTITGGIVGDDSRFDALRKVATWEPNYQPDGEVGPLGALMVDDGMTVLPPATALAPDPAIHAATVFAGMLRERGITVGGGESHAVAPAGATPVASLPSAAVRDIVGEMMRQSDNTTAEVLLKELGYRFGGAGSSAAGATVVHDALAARNLPVSGLVMHDGSGLDRGDRVTCELLAGALVADGRRSPLADGLAVPGMPGTLQKRFVAGVTASLKDRLRGKTGTLKGVSALSGWIDAPPGATVGPLTFSLVANGLPKAALGPALADKVAAALATFPSAPSLEALGPKPAVAS